MQRWWFTPLYDAFHTSDDETAFQFAGQRAQLLSQEEKADAQGKRSAAKRTRKSTRRFAKQFTEKFPALCAEVPVFAELQNLMDLSILGALLDKKRIPERVGWKMSLFLDPKRAPVLEGHTPKQVPTIYNYKVAGRSLVTGLINGGVDIRPRRMIDDVEFTRVARGDLHEARDALEKSHRPPSADRWWWD